MDSREKKIQTELERIRKGFPWLDIVAAATPGNGIVVLDEKMQQEALEYNEQASVDGRCKFVPASGAASRMFKDIFASLEKPNPSGDKLSSEIEHFAFYSPEIFPAGCNVAEKLLLPSGLEYGSKPKAVLKFHRYPDECRTAFAEHLVEGQSYMKNEDSSVNIIFTISPEHRELFEKACAEVKEVYEKRYGVRYNIEFTCQDPQTNTVAADGDGKPFVKSDGSILFRPAGHGALIYNLNKVPGELVSIKNIDNVCLDSMKETTSRWKKILMGKALELRDIIFAYLHELDLCSGVRVFEAYPNIPGYNPPRYDAYASQECQALCQEIEDFLYKELCISIPVARSCEDRVGKLRAILNRPIRVCGMVKNEGEPGGGPFIIREKDGSTSLQILESAQIDKSDPHSRKELESSTHFNPVDIVCCLKNYKGERFDLPAYVDENTGLVSSKSFEGKELKALELPGLWNGSMSRWNTMFVEVPVETFNPVKVVLDLLRPSHNSDI